MTDQVDGCPVDRRAERFTTKNTKIRKKPTFVIFVTFVVRKEEPAKLTP
jgi:hypothetical protein